MSMTTLEEKGLEAVAQVNEALRNLGLVAFLASQQGEGETVPEKQPETIRKGNGIPRVKKHLSSHDLYTANGETHTIGEWAKLLETSSDTIRWRIRRGWKPEKVVSPVNHALGKGKKPPRGARSGASAAQGYWAKMSPKERHVEMLRRAAVRREHQIARESVPVAV